MRRVRNGESPVSLGTPHVFTNYTSESEASSDWPETFSDQDDDDGYLTRRGMLLNCCGSQHDTHCLASSPLDPKLFGFSNEMISCITSIVCKMQADALARVPHDAKKTWKPPATRKAEYGLQLRGHSWVPFGDDFNERNYEFTRKLGPHLHDVKIKVS